MLKRLLARDKADEEINITVGPGLVTQYGAEQGETLDTECTDLTLGFLEATNGLVSGKGYVTHALNLPNGPRRANEQVGRRENPTGFWPPCSSPGETPENAPSYYDIAIDQWSVI